MSSANVSILRRSSRVPIQIPIHVTSLEPKTHFSEVCETLVVNAHGCALRLPVPLDKGSALHLHSKENFSMPPFSLIRISALHMLAARHWHQADQD